MLNKIRLCFIAILIINAALKLSAQDPYFSQFYSNSLYTNPAFAGKEVSRVALAYRMQYFGLPGGSVTFNASYDQRVNKIGGGFGIMFTNSIAGEILRENHFNLAYAYEFPLNKDLTIRFGIQGGFFQKTLNWDKFRWPPQFPPNVHQITNTITRGNFAFGGLIHFKKFFAGFACHNITQPNQSFYNYVSKLPVRYTLHGGYEIPVFEKSKHDMLISPNILFMTQGKYSQINTGLNFTYGPFIAGVGYRHSTPNLDALIVLLGIRQGDFKFGYSLDLSNNTGPGGKTAHEITASYQFGQLKQQGMKKIGGTPSF